MKFKMLKQVRDNKIIRESFMRLSEETFGLSFKEWYESGFWTDNYIPYVLLDGNRVVANVSVNIMNFIFNGIPKRYVQLGTVMTDSEYRNLGLSRTLIEEVISEWKDLCDCIYLFANDTVFDFYPKFGFVPVKEYKYVMPVSNSESDLVKLDIRIAEDRMILEQCYYKLNPYASFTVKDGYGLLMFYCGSFMKDSIYYSSKFNVVCIVNKEDDNFVCTDIFGDCKYPLKSVVSAFAGSEATSVVLGFSPKDTENCYCEEINNGLFILKNSENIFADNKLMFPELSRA